MLLHGADLPGMFSRFHNVNPGKLFTAALVMFLLSFAHAARWVIIIRANNGHMRFATSLKLVLVGYFFSQALPSSIGGDAMRVWEAHRGGLSLDTALNTVVMDRLTALAALLIMTAVAMPWLMDIVSEPAARYVLLLMLAAGAIGFVVLLNLSRLPESVFRWRVVRAAIRLSQVSQKVLLKLNSATVTLVLSVGVHIGVAFVVFILADALGVDANLTSCILLMPLVMLATLAPISIAGWGVREGAMVLALGLIHVTRTDAIAVSVLFGATLLVTSLPGGMLWWRIAHSSSGKHNSTRLYAADDIRKQPE